MKSSWKQLRARRKWERSWPDSQTSSKESREMSKRGKQAAREIAEALGQGENPAWWLPGGSKEENRASLQESRRLYLLGHDYKVIFQATGIPRSQFNRHKKHWDDIKERELQRFVQKRIAKKAQELEEIVALSLGGLKEHLRRVIARGEDMSAKDAKLLSDIIANVDRIGRLEQGKPTDIKRYETMSPDELKEEARKIVADLAEEDPIVDYSCH